MEIVSKVPVLLLTGYLGSGKTTLVNRILTNRRGIKFAVIVNDLGEVNIDADLIEKGGVVGKKDDSLVALQNGCICCTLKMDLVEQINDIIGARKFDYIVIEASGICEPAPIAQTICSMPSILPPVDHDSPIPSLDCIVTVVDALRLQSEFSCGDTLPFGKFEEDDLERLIIEQVEFCNMILLNKASEVTPAELGRIKEILRHLQPKAQIVECDFCDVDLDTILHTGLFDFEKVATSAAWIDAIEGDVEEHDEHHEHEEHEEHEHEEHHHGEHHEHEHHGEHHGEHGHHHHHCHNEEEGEAEEYGVGTFVYYTRRPFDINKFDYFVASKWPKSIIRAKGICYFADETDKCYLFEQAGVQKTIRDAGLWYATMPEDQLRETLLNNPKLARDWDFEYGDRMIKIVIIGQHLDKASITADLDACLYLPV